MYGRGTTTAAASRLMRGITHKCNSESAGGPREEQTPLGLATPEDVYSTLHKCYSYSSSSAQESYTFSDGCACKASQVLLLYWTTTEGQRVRSGASSEGQRGRGAEPSRQSEGDVTCRSYRSTAGPWRKARQSKAASHVAEQHLKDKEFEVEHHLKDNEGEDII